MLKSNSYDFIFLGAGCASLSLLMRMLKTRELAGKKILLIDKAPKTKNDRTWCFWEDKPGFFEEIVYKQWDKISVIGDGQATGMDISPYHYKMIRGIDLYNYCFTEIAKHRNVEIVYADIGGYAAYRGVRLTLNGQDFWINEGAHVFNSVIPSKDPGITLKLLQHFKGWVIETNQPVFDPAVARIMDFRVPQEYGTCFAYQLPFTPTRALVEYTVFSKEVLQPVQYENQLRSYLSGVLGIDEYKIEEEEFGVIPMTNERFNRNVSDLGTVGGQTKGSTGYTFQFIQKHSEAIVQALSAGKYYLPRRPSRFRFYDDTLLDVLYHNKVPGKKIFTDLFKKNKPQSILRFLDNESSLKEELKIISSLPVLPFLRAALRQIK